MATGVPLSENIKATLTASVPYKNPYNYPPLQGLELRYPNKSKLSEILGPIKSSFTKLDDEGRFNDNQIISKNDLILCDNLYGLHFMIEKGIKVDLIYIDPPYNTGFDFQSRNLEHAYSDNYNLASYIEYMRVRLILMKEVLSESGSIYIHIGHQMLAHLKIIMDEVFGQSNFRNIITRRKCSSKNFTKHQYPNLHDFILFYSKTDSYTWNKPSEKPSDDWINKEYNKKDEKGRYKLVPIHAPGVRNGETGMSWKGMMPPKGKHWQYTPSKLDDFDRDGYIHWSKTGNPRKKVYLESDKTIPITDYWPNFRDAHHQSVEITGYPTEKNFEMIKLIVEASSNLGDIVFDPFCGSGTTLHAARDLGRAWIGMDQSFTAIKYSLNRLKNGSSPMGDFVQNQFENKVVLKKTIDQKFRFLIDADVLKTHKNEIMGFVNPTN